MATQLKWVAEIDYWFMIVLQILLNLKEFIRVLVVNIYLLI